MNRALLCLGGVALALCLGVSTVSWADESTAPAVATDELQQLLGEAPSDVAQISSSEPFLVAAFSCPSYTIPCKTNAGCDTYCGTPGWGVCQWMGSAQRKCCFCLG